MEKNEILLQIENVLEVPITDKKNMIVGSSIYGPIPISVPKTLTELMVEEGELCKRIIYLSQKSFIDEKTAKAMLEAIQSEYEKMKEAAMTVGRFKLQDIEHWKLQIEEGKKILQVQQMFQKEEHKIK